MIRGIAGVERPGCRLQMNIPLHSIASSAAIAPPLQKFSDNKVIPHLG